jgi:hypothetical protein
VTRRAVPRLALLACASCSHAVIPPAATSFHRTAEPLGRGRIEAAAFAGGAGHQLDGAAGGGPRVRWGATDSVDLAAEAWVAGLDHDVTVHVEDGSERSVGRAWAARGGAALTATDWLALLAGAGLGDAPTATFAAADAGVVLSMPRPWIGWLWPYVGGRAALSAPLRTRTAQIGGFVQDAGPTAWLGTALGLRVGREGWFVAGEVALAEAIARPTRWADAAARELEPGETEWVAKGAHSVSFAVGMRLR